MSKDVFTLLMGLVVLAGLWMGGKFLYHLHDYFLLSENTKAHALQWEVEEIKSGKFSIAASFEFQVQKQMLTHRFRFPKPVYQNTYLAQNLIDQWKLEEWEVWYNPRNPQIASLQKRVPLKEGIYFGLCLVVFLYFAWLRVYVRKMNNLDSHSS